MTIRSAVRSSILQAFSLLVTAFLFLSIFSLQTGLLTADVLLSLLVTLVSAIAIRYVLLYHAFSVDIYKKLLLVPLIAILSIAGTNAVTTVYRSVSFQEIHSIFRRETIQIGTASALPDWWFAVVILAASLLVLLGGVLPEDNSHYPKPSAIPEIARSPVYFGFSCSFFGLWAVLFVGVSVQRVVVIAPIFEELLKFGIALVLGSTLFGRSFAARVGIAIVVGSVFGVVEHITTYPAEDDVMYVFRTLFHMTTTVLSVSVYSLFESKTETRLQWIAPAYSMILHFMFNTFAVLSAVISMAVIGTQDSSLSLLYGSIAILLACGLFVLVIVHGRTIIAIHRPLAHVLSDLV